MQPGRDSSLIWINQGKLHRPLRLHLVGNFEEFPRIGHKLRVTWMVNGFHAKNDVHQLGVMVVNVLDQLSLGIGRPGDQNRARIGNGLGNRMQKRMVFTIMPAAYGICLVMDMPCWMIGMQNQGIDV